MKATVATSNRHREEIGAAALRLPILSNNCRKKTQASAREQEEAFKNREYVDPRYRCYHSGNAVTEGVGLPEEGHSELRRMFLRSPLEGEIEDNENLVRLII